MCWTSDGCCVEELDENGAIFAGLGPRRIGLEIKMILAAER